MKYIKLNLFSRINTSVYDLFSWSYGYKHDTLADCWDINEKYIKWNVEGYSTIEEKLLKNKIIRQIRQFNPNLKFKWSKTIK